ncbi:MAG: HEAT repeat domain-containing protein [Candidatus Nitrosotenuis sp.]
MSHLDEIRNVIESDSREDKIKILESLSQTSDSTLIQLVISKLDDDDIQVRGEAFAALMLNENDISDILIQSLKSPRKNIRGYSALILANRNEKRAIPAIVELASDESASVRSCAIGALGYLKAVDGTQAIAKCINDYNSEVRKSAIKSALDLGNDKLLKQVQPAKSDDQETRLLLDRVKRTINGPGGI